MNEKRKINVLIADRMYPITVYTDREEELYRKAARHVNNRLNKYRSHFGDESPETLMAMVAFESVYYQLDAEDRNDTEPFTQKLHELTHELENLFRNERK